MRKIKIQSIYFQRNYWEIQVPQNLSYDDAEDWAHDKVHEITEKLKIKSSINSSEEKEVKLLLEIKEDHETQLITEEIWEEIKGLKKA